MRNHKTSAQHGIIGLHLEQIKAIRAGRKVDSGYIRDAFLSNDTLSQSIENAQVPHRWHFNHEPVTGGIRINLNRILHVLLR